MKKIFYFLVISLLTTLPSLAQNEGISFQGLARNAAGEVIVSQNISLRLSILLNSVTGEVAYTETRQVTTNPQGIFAVVVGDGTANSKTGNFSTIEWGTASKFIKVEMDTNAGSNFTVIGTSKLQPVPFAYYAYGVDAENVQGIVPVGSGGTGVASMAELKTSLGVDQVNNTADANKPLSTAATTALATKVDKEIGKGLSSNDYTTAEKIKLASITGGGTGPAGPQGPVGLPGAPGLLSSGAAAGNTPYWNGLEWVVNSSNLFNNGSNLGIGTANPTEKLDIIGNVKTSGTLTSGTVTYPNIHGSANQVLTTTGSGALTWSTPSDGAITVGPISTSATSNGAIVTSGILNLAPADATNGGIVTTGAQTFAGAKTFNNDVTAPNFLGNATTATSAGNITATSNSTLTSLSSLNTVGTITSGTWSGTTIAIANGGTGAITAGAALTNLGAQSSANLSTDVTGTDATSLTKYPAVRTIKDYVDTQVAAATIADATTTLKGKIQLGGDLAGTAVAPTVPGLALKAPIESPTFTGTVSGITKAMVGLENADNTSDVNKPISTATQTALNLKAPLESPTFTGTPVLPTATTGVTQAAGDNSTKIATTAFVVSSVTAGTPDATTSATGKIQLAGDLAGTAAAPTVPGLALKAPIESPTFTGTVSGITKAMVGLANADNTSDANKPISTATQTALNLKAPLESPTFTGTVSGITKAMVGLANADNTSDVNKPISTATQTALNLKAPLESPTFTGAPVLPTATSAITQAAGDNSTKIATTAFVVSSVIAGTPEATTSSTGKIQLGGDLAGSGTTATAPIITDNAITTSKINANAITSAKILDGTIATDDIANASITNAKISGPISIANGGTGSATQNFVDLSTTQTIAGAKTFSSAITGDISGNAGTATTLATARNIYGNSFDGSAALTGVIASTFGGTGNGFTKFTGPTTAEKIFTLPDASTTILTTNTAVTIAQGGTGATTAAGALTALGAQAANLSTNMTTDAASLEKYPAVKTVKDYVDASVTSGAPDATTIVKGKIQLAGDLSGTADLPTVAANAITSAKIKDGEIVNADISVSAEIVDTKLATIATAGKVSNSATTATEANTASAIVARDNSGNFIAGTITADLTGTASRSTNIAGGAIGSIPYQSAANTTALLPGNSLATKRFLTQSGDGSAATAPVWAGVAVSDITGTLPVANGGTGVTTTAANLIFAGPTSGSSAAAPSFRALVAADLPTGSTNYVNNGTTQQASTDFNISGSGTIGTTLAVAGNATIGGTATITGATTISSLTATKGVFTDASKNLTSTGTLGTDQGGTGMTSFTSGGAMYATSTSALTTGTLPVSAGGTGSTTQNFVDLTTAQTIAGDKTFSSTIVGSISGNAATVTNGVYTTNKLSALSATTSSELAGVISDETGTGSVVLATSPTLVTPVLGVATGTSLSVSGQLTSTVATGTAPLVVTSTTPVANLNIGGNAATVTTNANLTGDVTSTGNATTVVKINGTSLAGLSTGILKNTTSTGVPSIAVAADFPTLNQNTTGTAANVTGTVAIANGGTGSSTQNFVDLTTNQTIAGDKIFSGSSTVVQQNLTVNSAGTSGQGIILSDDGDIVDNNDGAATFRFGAGIKINDGNKSAGTTTNITLTNTGNITATGSVTASQLTSNVATGTAPLVVTSTTPVANLNIGGNAATATNIAGGASGSIPYQTAAATTAMLANGTDGQVLTLASGVPSWASPAGGTSVGSISASSTANGASITSGVLNLAPADGTNGGVVTTSAQTIAGAKTFSSTIVGSISGNAATVTNGVYTTNKLSALSATTSSEFAGVISDETGTGSVVLATSPTLVTPVLGVATGTSLSVSGQLTSTVATGAAPLVVTSTTPVENLNIGGNAATATTATNIAGGLSGSIPYQTAAGTTSLLPKGTDGQVLALVGGLPAWSADAGVTTMAAIGSVPNANGASISTNTLTLQPANATFGGVVTTATQTFAGAKTFSSDITVNGITIGEGGGSVVKNTALGLNAMSATATGAQNTAVGNVALTALTSGTFNVAVGSESSMATTEGFDNVAIGYQTLKAATNAFLNTAIGSYALTALNSTTSNDRNTAVGVGSLGALTSGQYNTTLGQATLQGITTGSSNVSIGQQAGLYINGGNIVTTANNSVFIGAETKPAAATTTNEIIIGYNAVGGGSNTTTLGNSSITNTRIFGALNLPNVTASTSTTTGALTVAGGVGVAGATNIGGITTITNATASISSTTGALKVAGGAGIAGALNVGGNTVFTGTIEIDGGSPGAGKVLVSDAGGLASWSNAAGSTVVTNSTTYAITTAEAFVFYNGSAAAAFTIPAAAAGNAGKEITIKNKTGFGITITPASGTIYIDSANTGAANVAIGIEASNNWIKLVSDGTQWNVFRALF